MDQDKLRALLEAFGIAAENKGVCLGPGQWRGGGAAIVSTNPANEKPLARIATASADDLAAVIATATTAAHAWRDVPAPQRGEAVRRFGDLRCANTRTRWARWYRSRTARSKPKATAKCRR